MIDRQLYRLCKKYGARALAWRRKFAGLLPEVFRRRLYEKKGFSSIFESAAKLAGMSQEQVRLVLNLEKRLEDRLVLKHMLVRGEVSASKLARVVSIVTDETQDYWAAQVKNLPKSALETLVKDSKTEDENGLFKTQNEPKDLPGHEHGAQRTESAKISSELRLSPDVEKQLLDLQQKGINVNALLLEFLKKRELEIAREKEELAAKQTVANPKSRYMPARVKEVLKKEHGAKCSVPHCARDSEAIHHTQRFGLNRSHDPHFLAPLCKEHHLIAHSMDRKFQQLRGGAMRGGP